MTDPASGDTILIPNVIITAWPGQPERKLIIRVGVKTYASNVPSGLTGTVDMLELTAMADGVPYRHIAALPPEDHRARSPESVDDVIRGATEELKKKITAAKGDPS